MLHSEYLSLSYCVNILCFYEIKFDINTQIKAACHFIFLDIQFSGLILFQYLS